MLSRLLLLGAAAGLVAWLTDGSTTAPPAPGRVVARSTSPPATTLPEAGGPRLVGRARAVTPPGAGPAGQPLPVVRPPARDPPPVPVLGRVADRCGRPVPEAVVLVTWLRPTSTSYPRQVGTARIPVAPDGSFEALAPAEAHAARVTVDAGVAWIAPPRLDVLRGGPLRWWRTVGRAGTVDLDAEGLPWGGSLRQGDAWPFLRLRVESAAPLDGRVLEATGEPAERITVRAQWHDAVLGWRRVEAQTDAEGLFALAVPAGARRLGLGVPAVGPRLGWTCGRARRYRERENPGLWRHDVAPGERDVLLRLPSATSIEGRIELEDGTGVVVPDTLGPPGVPPLERPLRGGRLRVARLDEDGVGVAPDVRAGPAGATSIHGLAPGRYLLYLGSDESLEGPPFTGRAVVDVPGPPFLLVGRPTFVLEGTLLGRDVGGSCLSWTPAGEGGDLLGTCEETDASGRFRLEGLEARPGTLYANHPGDPRHAWLADLQPGGGPLEVALKRGLAIRGRVVGFDPYEAGRLTIVADRYRIDQDAVVRPDGRFELLGLPPGRFDLDVHAKHAGDDVRWRAHVKGVPAGSVVTVALDD